MKVWAGNMVLGGNRGRNKNHLTKSSQALTATKAAPVTSQDTASGRSHRQKMSQQDSPFESDTEQILSQTSPQASSASPVILLQFEKMLHKALKQTSDQITKSLTKEIRELGNRTAALEIKMDEIEITTQENITELEQLKEENLILQTKLEDYENRARRSNLRIRGIPETVTDLQSTITALLQELKPDIPIERLELDRVHRALTAKKKDGPPRDIITKFHYYRTKEQILIAAREKKELNFQGHNYQIFADLSQLTITKRRSMKPQLMELQRHNIMYQWGFPFSVRFNYQGTIYRSRSADELQQTLLKLNLTEPTSSNSPTRRRMASSSPSGSTQKISEQNGNHHSHKRGRYATSSMDQEDSMD